MNHPYGSIATSQTEQNRLIRCLWCILVQLSSWRLIAVRCEYSARDKLTRMKTSLCRAWYAWMMMVGYDFPWWCSWPRIVLVWGTDAEISILWSTSHFGIVRPRPCNSFYWLNIRVPTLTSHQCSCEIVPSLSSESIFSFAWEPSWYVWDDSVSGRTEGSLSQLPEQQVSR